MTYSNPHGLIHAFRMGVLWTLQDPDLYVHLCQKTRLVKVAYRRYGIRLQWQLMILAN